MRWTFRFITPLVGVPMALAAASAAPAAVVPGPQLVPLALQAPDTQALTATGAAACTTPAPVHTYAFYHCYGPAQITAAYGVDAVHSSGDLGQGQTIVLVDSYGSPTGAQDLQYFHDTFFSSLPNPNFDEVYPQGKPDYHNTAHGNGMSGPAAAAGCTSRRRAATAGRRAEGDVRFHVLGAAEYELERCGCGVRVGEDRDSEILVVHPGLGDRRDLEGVGAAVDGRCHLLVAGDCRLVGVVAAERRGP